MKKSLLALAVLGSFAAAAQAQNVTLYGTVAHSVSQYDNKSSDLSTVSQGNDGDFLSSSVLGITGTEDLGGGLKAAFRLEGDLQELGNGLTFGRHQWASIGYDAVSLKIGRVQDFAKTLYVVYGFNNVLLFDAVQGINKAAFRSGIATQLGGRFPNTTAVEGKVANVTYQVAYSNNIGGDNGSFGQGGTADAAVLTRTEQGTVGAMTNIGPVSVGLAYVARTSDDPAKGDGASGFVAGIGGKVGPVNLGFNYIQNKDDGGANLDSNSYQLNAVAALGGGFSVHGNYLFGEKDRVANATDASTNKETNSYGLMLVKDFSKRTAAFAGARFSELESNNNVAKREETLYTVGVQHRF